MTRRIAVVTAGLSSPSSTRLLADQLTTATTEALRASGQRVEVDVVDLRALAHGLADRLVTGFATGELEEAVEAVSRADGVIAVTPVFSASYSGLFKTFFDVLEPGALAGTPVLLGATAGTSRHSLVLEHAMRPLFAYLKAIVAPTAVFAATEDFGGDRAAGLDGRITAAGGELAALVAAAPVRPVEDPFAEVVDFATLLAR